MESDPFTLHFYQGGRSLSEHALYSLLTDLPAAEADLQMRLDGDIDVLVYSKHADFRQSNIGIDSGDAGNIGGTTTIHGKKLFAWFDGDALRSETSFDGIVPHPPAPVPVRQ